VANFANAVHRSGPKPEGDASPGPCGLRLRRRHFPMSRFGSGVAGDELRKDGGNGEGERRVLRQHGDTGSES